MFGYNHNHRGKFMRLFWVPIRIGEPDRETLEGAAAAGGAWDDFHDTRHISDLSWHGIADMACGAAFATWNVF